MNGRDAWRRSGSACDPYFKIFDLPSNGQEFISGGRFACRGRAKIPAEIGFLSCCGVQRRIRLDTSKRLPQMEKPSRDAYSLVVVRRFSLVPKTRMLLPSGRRKTRAKVLTRACGMYNQRPEAKQFTGKLL
jgi:hypothetical protein